MRLVVLNGPPGIGKSTLAGRYVGIRRQLGGWDKEGVGPLYDPLAAVLAARPATVVLESRFGDADEIFGLLLMALRSPVD